MYIVKTIVEAMGGTISVRSQPGVGTEFVLDLWVEVVPHPQPEEDPVQQENPLHGRRILLVEDNEVNTLVARRLLEKQGCIVTAASNGQLAVDAFRTSPKGWYDAVLMDIRMPVMDGLEASRTIRLLTRADAKTVPIIAMTANAYASDVEAALAAGMNAHLAKPVDPALLYRTLAQFIRR